MPKHQKLRCEANKNLLITQNSSSRKTSLKIIDTNIITQQDMASDLDNNGLPTDKDPTLSTDTTKDKSTDDTNSSDTPCAYKPRKYLNYKQLSNNKILEI